MRMTAPASGVVVDVRDAAVERYKSRGYVPVNQPERKPARKPAARKTARKKPATAE